jgi:putative membrane protein
MKSYYLGLALLISTVALSSCSSNDSTSKAEELNNERIEKQAIAVGADAKEDAKQVAKYMVQLSADQTTSLELCRTAVQKATNPEVRSLAQQTLLAHQQDDRQLRVLAKQINVTLPVEQSGDGKKLIDKIAGLERGTAFDVAYLESLATLTDEMADISDDLAGDAPTDEVKKFAKEAKRDNEQLRDRAKQSKNALD